MTVDLDSLTVDQRREVKRAARAMLARESISRWSRFGPPTVLGRCVLETWQEDAARRLEHLYRWAADRSPGSRQIRVLAFEAPPQVGKSEIVSRRGPTWAAAELGLSLAVCSYAQALATRHVMGCRSLLRSGEAARVWPHLQRRGSDDVDTQADYSVPRAGGGPSARVIARGRDGALTGETLDVIVLDDLYKSGDDYQSVASRREVDDFLRTQVLSRLIERGGGLVDMGTRWGVHDTRGWWQARVAEMRAAGLDVEVEVASYPLRGDEPWRHGPRGYLTPRWDEAKEHAARVLYGHMAAAILDCAPVESSGGLFAPAYLDHRYVGIPRVALESCEATHLAVDPAETEGGGDWSVIQWWGTRGADSLLLGQWRGQWSPGALVTTLREVIAETRPLGVLIEDTSGGKVALAAMADAIPGVVRVPGGGWGSKLSKIRGTMLLWEQGRVLFPEPSAMTAWCYGRDDDGLDLRGRLLRLRGERPDMRGEVDDEADAAAIYLRWRLDQGGQGSILDLLDELGV